MATGLQRPTATIYQFPVGGRMTASQLQREAAMATPVHPNIMYDSWYHDAAISDSKPSTKTTDKPHS